MESQYQPEPTNTASGEDLPYGLRVWDKLLPGPGIFLARGLVYVSLVLIASAVTWMGLTQMDVVVKASGQLIVKGEPMQITAPEAALVLETPVKVGQHVSAGDVLLRLDAYRHTSEADRVAAEINELRLEAAGYRTNSENLAQVRSPLEKELDMARQSAAVSAQQLERVEVLEKGTAVAPTEVQAKRRELSEANGRIARLERELEIHRMDVAKLLQEAEQAQARVDALAVKLQQLHEYTRRATIRAPIAGTVTYLSVAHPGSVIDAARPAVTLLPDGQPLMACIEIPNESMSRLDKGLRVFLELNAFPREDYGGVEGRLEDIEPDAGHDGSYRAWVSLGAQEIGSVPLLQRVKPGLLVKGRIHVEQRSILDLLLKPLKRLGRPVSVAS